MFKEVSCVISGASKVEQLHSNLEALKIRNLSKKEITALLIFPYQYSIFL